MTSLAEQFFAAAAGKTPLSMPFSGQSLTQLPVQFPLQLPVQIPAQFCTQVDFFQSFTSQAFDSASRVMALNLATSRASVECSTRAVQALIASRDPRDLLTLGGAAEEQVHSLFSYTRELMSIAGSVQPFAAGIKAAAAPAEAVAEVAEVAADTAEAATAAAAAAYSAPVHSAPAGEAELVVVAEPEQEPALPAEQRADEAEPAPVAGQTDIVIAAGQGEPHAGVAPHPASAPVPAAEATVQVQKLAPAASSSSSSSSSSKRRK